MSSIWVIGSSFDIGVEYCVFIRRRDEAEGILQALKSEVKVESEFDILQDANEDVSMDEATPATEKVSTDLHQASYMSKKLLELVDSIQ